MEKSQINIEILVIYDIIVLILLIMLILYFVFMAIPRDEKCEQICKNNIPENERIIDYNVEALRKVCKCFYSESVKNFILK